MIHFMKTVEWSLAYSTCLMHVIFLSLLLILGPRVLAAIVSWVYPVQKSIYNNVREHSLSQGYRIIKKGKLKISDPHYGMGNWSELNYMGNFGIIYFYYLL